MSDIITAVTSIVNAAFGWVGTAVSTITAPGNELLLMAVVLPFVGLGVGLLRRLFGTKA